MSQPVHLNLLSFFYPIGNASAVCLTQNLIREQDANLLLLGCGDVRNILYTVHSKIQLPGSSLDITCCDIEPAIIARNVILFTLFVDDKHDVNADSIWNVYYHMFLDEGSLSLLQIQSKKLYALSSSLQTWNDSDYGRLLRFCDNQTLAMVRKVWAAYNVDDLSEEEKAQYNTRFHSNIKRTLDIKTAWKRQGVTLAAARSAAPFGLKAMKDAPEAFEYFWNHGISQGTPENLAIAKHPNPMFGSSETDSFTLHYGLDPLTGFHLAAAYAPLDGKSTMHPDYVEYSEFPNMIQTARSQFRAWGVSFRNLSSSDLTLRFCVADALAFCFTLQHIQVNLTASANWYRDAWHVEPLVLDGDDYASSGSAPLSFDVIDTSTLIDSLGAINLLVAAAPLLAENISSTIYTETLVRREEDLQTTTNSMLCGNLPTMAFLLGLFPVDYWTNITAVSAVDDVLIDKAVQDMLKTEKREKSQLHSKMVWKRPAPHPSIKPTMDSGIRFKEKELAHLLHQIYVDMFKHENLPLLISQMKVVEVVERNTLPRYHRGSFAVFLRYLKNRINVNWKQTVTILLDLIDKDIQLIVGRNFIQELCLYLHLLGVHSVDDFQNTIKPHKDDSGPESILSWNNIPTVLCVTLTVPRAKLKLFTDLPLGDVGTPLLHCTVGSSYLSTRGEWQNTFAAIQLSFGEVKTSGARYSNEFTINIVEDAKGWVGDSPLIVSFLIPSWVALVEHETARAAFNILPTPATARTFIKVLGLEMNVWQTFLGDETSVYISKHRPNLRGHASICSLSHAPQEDTIRSEGSARIEITANVDKDHTKIASFTARLTAISRALQNGLSKGPPVEAIQVDPFTVHVTIGSATGANKSIHVIHFPVPILIFRSDRSISRKSSHVEIVAPVYHPLDLKDSENLMYPIFREKGVPVLWNLHRLNPDHLPRLDTSKKSEIDWLIPHTSLMFSVRERKARDAIPVSDLGMGARISFKDSVFSMLMHFAGLQGANAKIFGLKDLTGGSLDALIFGSSLRLDLSNHTVVLDAAVLPLTAERRLRLRKFMVALSDIGICLIKVDDRELVAWKHAIPAFVERCRDWEHKPSCEYVSREIPLSVDVGKTPICSCGNGIIPSNFATGVPLWKEVSKYVVRLAISPCFPVTFVEKIGLAPVGSSPTTQTGMCRLCGDDKTIDGKKLLRCGRCQTVEYCSEKCQRSDWKEHKKSCHI